MPSFRREKQSSSSILRCQPPDAPVTCVLTTTNCFTQMIIFTIYRSLSLLFLPFRQGKEAFFISSQPPGSPSVWIWTRPIVLFNSSSFTMCLHGTFTDHSYFCLKTASHPHQSLLCINLKVTERYLSGGKKKKVSRWVTSNSTDPSQSYRPGENVLRSPVPMCKVRNYFQYASSKIISETKKSWQMRLR